MPCVAVAGSAPLTPLAHFRSPSLGRRRVGTAHAWCDREHGRWSGAPKKGRGSGRRAAEAAVQVVAKVAADCAIHALLQFERFARLLLKLR